MGNNDGIETAMLSVGKNLKEKFNGGMFSFAFGNEIALVLEGKYYILNCNKNLWNEVKKEIIKTKKNKSKLIKFWEDKSNSYKISDWSDSFSDLGGLK